ncbi:hypothetical protein K2173_014105 [Erythroxylum novogranatense]|uniref:U1-type domain-containing protein n=1 Tax=Erythroxylum novogranatense TaxID=1862640 RepID=A0AAV8SDD0_9ROSI|nr:hypothetical protein K2173_014105 [Erythroxylum novogranatense]
MEYTAWSGIKPNPNPPSQIEPCYYASSNYSLYDPSQSSLYYPEPNTSLKPPGVDFYASVSSYPPVSISGYFADPNPPNWAAKEAVRQYGSDPAAQGMSMTSAPNGTEQLAAANTGSLVWPKLAVHPQPWKKRQKKTKAVQSAFCEICKVDCNSGDVFDQHKLGKRHKKNLEKLQADCDKTKKSGNKQQTRKKVGEALEDLETKRRKIVQGGAAAEAVRVCAVCNIVCNSETVFNYHLAGQKHANMLKKQAAGVATPTPTLI